MLSELRSEDERRCGMKSVMYQTTEKQIMTALKIRIQDDHDRVSREAYELINQKNAQIEHLEAEVERLNRFIKDLMKDEEKQ